KVPWLIDSTLRDGEQAAGVAFSEDDSLEIARELTAIGINELEVGTPAMGRAEIAKMSRIARTFPKLRTTAWCRAKPSDIDAAIASGVSAIHLSFPVSRVHFAALGKDLHWALECASALIPSAKTHFGYVSVGAQDASRASDQDLIRFARHVRALGVDRLRIADTVGIWNPLACAERVSHLKQAFPDLTIGVHTHNDLGMATANAIAAAMAGADSVDVTVNGLGERAGNAALEEVVMALEVSLGVSTGIRTEALLALSKRVARLAGRPLAAAKAVTGSRVFSHESGIHVHAMLRDRRSYEAFEPERVGHAGREYVLGKHSGTAAMRHLMNDCGASSASGEIVSRVAQAGQPNCDSPTVVGLPDWAPAAIQR
ncbi:MAG TPA: hypothetical protein VIV60_09725, partial [Polyangiaceae bacterium]